MSKLPDLENGVNMRLLNHDGLDDVTLVAGGDDEGRWSPSHVAPGGPLLTPSRSASPESRLAKIAGSRRVLVRLFYAALLLCVATLVFVVSRKPIAAKVSSWRNPAPASSDLASSSPPTPSPPAGNVQDIHDHSLYLAPERSVHFRDNLVNGTLYVTAAPIGGFSNQVIAQINMLYMSVLTTRIPVVADFIPGHMHGNPGYLPTSEVYDLPRLAQSLQKPVLEWGEIKDRRSSVTDELGCWSLSTTLFGEGQGHFATEHEFNLDISLTPAPNSRFIPNTNHLNINALASLGWPEERANALQHAETIPNQGHNRTIPPDEHLLCYDQLYYAATVKPYEWFDDWVPAWTQVGKYLHWAPPMEELARTFIRGAFKLAPSDPFPSYISVHIRHTDFSTLCENQDDPTKTCYPPLSTYGEKIAEVRQELREKNGMSVDNVLVASDELDPAWWASVEELGWHRIDWEAEGTEAEYSEWYPIVLDSVALSLGKGFVGTTRSTLSLLAAKRVKDWEKGYVREVGLVS